MGLGKLKKVGVVIKQQYAFNELTVCITLVCPHSV